MVALDQYLYLCGGEDCFEGKVSRAVERFNTEHHHWECSSPLIMARSDALAVTLDGCIYLCGGVAESPLQAVERFDPFQGHWEALSPLAEPRCRTYGSGIAVLNGCIYIHGGDFEDSTERFSPSQGYWTMLPCCASRHYSGTVVSFAGYLYVCGGNDGTVLHLTVGENIVERFNPASDSWEAVQSMYAPHRAAASMATASFLYICGGRDRCGGDSNSVRSVERYEAQSGCWEVLPLSGWC